jgi:glycosyltransferase involved in cell wall biosynthesis/peptidoglycan/xylan/chitin deacetylase (PgdA/CDA1 family)
MRAEPERILVIRQGSITFDPRVRREVAALLDAGHTVDVIGVGEPGEPGRRRSGALTVYNLPSALRSVGGSASGYVLRYGAFLLLAGLLSGALHMRRRYALVQVHSLPDVLVFAALIPKLLGARVVLDLHEMMTEFFGAKFGAAPGSLPWRAVAAAEQASIRFADYAFTCTNEMRAAFIARGADAGRLGVVLNSSEEDVFDVERHPPRGSDDGGFVILCHGSVEVRYGIDTAIEAVALLRDEIPGLRLQVFGDGSYVEPARALAAARGVADRVAINGRWEPMPVLLDAIAGCDAGLVAMKRDAFRDLTHCNKMYDLVTMRRPVLMSRTRSVQAYFDEECFEYFESDDPRALADAIVALHGDPARRAARVRHATNALEPYRWPRQREIYQGYIQRLLEPGSGADTGAGDEFFLHERYQRRRRRSAAMRAYYALKPLLPRALQLALRRRYAPLQARREFPAWPVEPLLVERRDAELRRRLATAPGARVALVDFWPAGRRYAVVLTHDVEGPAGIANIERVRAVERRHGFVSSWNFVAEEYPIPDGLFDGLRAEGCEIGLHGIHHDGRLFSSRAEFDRNLPAIRRYLAEWGAVGFRSPATHRNAEWMAALPVLYDSSFPDTDPFEPQPGGCCSIVPFRLGDVVELPITLVQDHTMWEILREPGIDRWLHKSEWIMRNHGLINVIVHPDYVVDPVRLALYDRFLAFLAAQPGGWHALPRDVARWWLQRESLTVRPGPGPQLQLAGTSDYEAGITYARERDGSIVFNMESDQP